MQTEDLGKTHSTPALRYQADFENERRWITFDLLSGRLAPGDAMWGYLRWAGGVAARSVAATVPTGSRWTAVPVGSGRSVSRGVNRSRCR